MKNKQVVKRRGEILAELLLQDMEPFFLAKATADVGYDFLAGFPNEEGGINNYAVQVKATEEPVASAVRTDAEQYERLAHSNIPALLLVIDVKQNKLFYSWITPHAGEINNNTVEIPVIEITDAVKKELQQQLQRGPMMLHPAMNLQQAERPAHL
ncbi:DUF4365 domain-containing protein [Candidatus Electronema sp. TJ]|uniref:DUF4365 domain-containing protein n=1 Tax=Candidatus Electronema sp. TJ TaxID=3401573 RepID=UPI003AA9105A